MIEYNTQQDSYCFNKDEIDFFINIGIVVTQRCNLRCIHCCEKVQPDEGNLSQIKKIIDKLAENNIKKICVTGGEPLLRKDIIDILKYIHSKKIDLTFSTNGTLVTREFLEKIKPYIQNIRFSIYGSEENHKAVTQKEDGYKIHHFVMGFISLITVPI